MVGGEGLKDERRDWSSGGKAVGLIRRLGRGECGRLAAGWRTPKFHQLTTSIVVRRTQRGGKNGISLRRGDQCGQRAAGLRPL